MKCRDTSDTNPLFLSQKGLSGIHSPHKRSLMVSTCAGGRQRAFSPKAFVIIMDKQNTLLHFKYGKLGHGEPDTETLKLPRSLFAEVFYPLEARGSWCSSAESHHSGSNTSQKAFIALKTHKSTFSSGCAHPCDLNPPHFRANQQFVFDVGEQPQLRALGVPWSHLCPIWCWHCTFQRLCGAGGRHSQEHSECRDGNCSAQLTQDWFLSCHRLEFFSPEFIHHPFQGPFPHQWS